MYVLRAQFDNPYDDAEFDRTTWLASAPDPGSPDAAVAILPGPARAGMAEAAARLLLQGSRSEEDALQILGEPDFSEDKTLYYKLSMTFDGDWNLMCVRLDHRGFVEWVLIQNLSGRKVDLLTARQLGLLRLTGP